MKPLGAQYRKKRKSSRPVILIVVGVLGVGGAAAFFLLQSEAAKAAEEATERFERAVEYNHLLDKPSEAVQELNKVLELQPNDWQAEYELGFSYLVLDQLTKAVDSLESALTHCPSDAATTVQMRAALAYRRRHEANGSDRDFRRSRLLYAGAAEDREYAAEAQHALGMMCLFETDRDLALARDYLKKVVDGHPDYEKHEEAATVLKSLEAILNKK